MKKAQELNVKGTPVRVLRVGEEDFICLTDMAAGRGDDVRAADVIKNWLRARYTLEFLGTWEQLHNPAFKVVEFDHFKAQAGLPSFTLSVSEWIESTNAVGLIVKNGRYGGTYAQKDIAFEFGSAISVLFKLYLIDEFQRLKAAEQAQTMEYLWSVLGSYYDSKVPEWHANVLAERENASEDEFEDWEDAKKELRGEFNQRCA